MPLILAITVAAGIIVSSRAAARENLLTEARFELGSPPATLSLPVEVTAATVFGPDDRARVSDTSAWPYRIVTQLVMFDPSGAPVATCSGVLLDADVVLTAAHCLWDGELDEPYDSILVVPGENADAFPFGTGFVPAGAISIPQGFLDTTDSTYDFGLAHIADGDFGEEIGPFAPVAAASDAFLLHEATSLFTAGYPGDKPLGTMWETAAPVQVVDDEFIFTRMDAFAGQSGSGMFGRNGDSAPAIIGVYIEESAGANIAVRFTAAQVTALHTYCVDDGCSFESVDLGEPAEPTPSPSPTPPSPSPTPPSPSPTAATPAPSRPASMPHRNVMLHVVRD